MSGLTPVSGSPSAYPPPLPSGGVMLTSGTASTGIDLLADKPEEPRTSCYDANERSALQIGWDEARDLSDVFTKYLKDHSGVLPDPFTTPQQVKDTIRKLEREILDPDGKYEFNVPGEGEPVDFWQANDQVWMLRVDPIRWYELGLFYLIDNQPYKAIEAFRFVREGLYVNPSLNNLTNPVYEFATYGATDFPTNADDLPGANWFAFKPVLEGKSGEDISSLRIHLYDVPEYADHHGLGFLNNLMNQALTEQVYQTPTTVLRENNQVRGFVVDRETMRVLEEDPNAILIDGNELTEYADGYDKYQSSTDKVIIYYNYEGVFWIPEDCYRVFCDFVPDYVKLMPEEFTENQCLSGDAPSDGYNPAHAPDPEPENYIEMTSAELNAYGSNIDYESFVVTSRKIPMAVIESDAIVGFATDPENGVVMNLFDQVYFQSEYFPGALAFNPEGWLTLNPLEHGLLIAFLDAQGLTDNSYVLDSCFIDTLETKSVVTDTPMAYLTEAQFHGTTNKSGFVQELPALAVREERVAVPPDEIFLTANLWTALAQTGAGELWARIYYEDGNRAIRDTTAWLNLNLSEQKQLQSALISVGIKDHSYIYLLPVAEIEHLQQVVSVRKEWFTTVRKPIQTNNYTRSATINTMAYLGMLYYISKDSDALYRTSTDLIRICQEQMLKTGGEVLRSSMHTFWDGLPNYGGITSEATALTTVMLNLKPIPSGTAIRKADPLAKAIQRFGITPAASRSTAQIQSLQSAVSEQIARNPGKNLTQDLFLDPELVQAFIYLFEPESGQLRQYFMIEGYSPVNGEQPVAKISVDSATGRMSVSLPIDDSTGVNGRYSLADWLTIYEHYLALRESGSITADPQIDSALEMLGRTFLRWATDQTKHNVPAADVNETVYKLDQTARYRLIAFFPDLQLSRRDGITETELQAVLVRLDSVHAIADPIWERNTEEKVNDWVRTVDPLSYIQREEDVRTNIPAYTNALMGLYLWIDDELKRVKESTRPEFETKCRDIALLIGVKYLDPQTLKLELVKMAYRLLDRGKCESGKIFDSFIDARLRVDLIVSSDERYRRSPEITGLPYTTAPKSTVDGFLRSATGYFDSNYVQGRDALVALADRMTGNPEVYEEMVVADMKIMEEIISGSASSGADLRSRLSEKLLEKYPFFKFNLDGLAEYVDKLLITQVYQTAESVLLQDVKYTPLVILRDTMRFHEYTKLAGRESSLFPTSFEDKQMIVNELTHLTRSDLELFNSAYILQDGKYQVNQSTLTEIINRGAGGELFRILTLLGVETEFTKSGKVVNDAGYLYARKIALLESKLNIGGIIDKSGMVESIVTEATTERNRTFEINFADQLDQLSPRMKSIMLTELSATPGIDLKAQFASDPDSIRKAYIVAVMTVMIQDSNDTITLDQAMDLSHELYALTIASAPNGENGKTFGLTEGLKQSITDQLIANNPTLRDELLKPDQDIVDWDRVFRVVLGMESSELTSVDTIYADAAKDLGVAFAEMVRVYDEQFRCRHDQEPQRSFQEESAMVTEAKNRIWRSDIRKEDRYIARSLLEDVYQHTNDQWIKYMAGEQLAMLSVFEYRLDDAYRYIEETFKIMPQYMKEILEGKRSIGEANSEETGEAKAVNVLIGLKQVFTEFIKASGNTGVIDSNLAGVRRAYGQLLTNRVGRNPQQIGFIQLIAPLDGTSVTAYSQRPYADGLPMQVDFFLFSPEGSPRFDQLGNSAGVEKVVLKYEGQDLSRGEQYSINPKLVFSARKELCNQIIRAIAAAPAGAEINEIADFAKLDRQTTQIILDNLLGQDLLYTTIDTAGNTRYHLGIAPERRVMDYGDALLYWGGATSVANKYNQTGSLLTTLSGYSGVPRPTLLALAGLDDTRPNQKTIESLKDAGLVREQDNRLIMVDWPEPVMQADNALILLSALTGNGINIATLPVQEKLYLDDLVKKGLLSISNGGISSVKTSTLSRDLQPFTKPIGRIYLEVLQLFLEDPNSEVMIPAELTDAVQQILNDGNNHIFTRTTAGKLKLTAQGLTRTILLDQLSNISFSVNALIYHIATTADQRRGYLLEMEIPQRYRGMIKNMKFLKADGVEHYTWTKRDGTSVTDSYPKYIFTNGYEAILEALSEPYVIEKTKLLGDSGVYQQTPQYDVLIDLGLLEEKSITINGEEVTMVRMSAQVDSWLEDDMVKILLRLASSKDNRVQKTTLMHEFGPMPLQELLLEGVIRELDGDYQLADPLMREIVYQGRQIGQLGKPTVVGLPQEPNGNQVWGGLQYKPAMELLGQLMTAAAETTPGASITFMYQPNAETIHTPAKYRAYGQGRFETSTLPPYTLFEDMPELSNLEIIGLQTFAGGTDRSTIEWSMDQLIQKPLGYIQAEYSSYTVGLSEYGVNASAQLPDQQRYMSYVFSLPFNFAIYFDAPDYRLNIDFSLPNALREEYIYRGDQNQ